MGPLLFDLLLMARSSLDGEALQIGTPSIWELFTGFSGVAIIGFGGVMPFARRMLVEQKRWMTSDEFNEAYALAQFLPGGNIVNLSVVVGQRFHGPLGSLAAVAGLLAGPVILVTFLGFIYFRSGQIAAVQDALAGLAAGAAGLIVAMAAKMAEPVIRRRAVAPMVMAALAFVAIAAEYPLLLVVGVLAPVSIALAWVRPS